MKEREMYNGTLLTRFEEAGHKYRVRDTTTGNEWIPGSITGRLSVINKPFLVPWAAKLAAESGDKDASRKVMEAAGERGTKVHEAIEEWTTDPSRREIDGQWLASLDSIVRPCVEQYLRWEENDLDPLDDGLDESELLVYSKRYGTCGTLDRLTSIEAEPYVIDYKTSKRVYPNHALQVSFYASALQEEGIVSGAKRGILHLRDKGYTFYTEEMITEKYGNIFECLQAFEGCLSIDRWQKAGKGRK